MRNFPKKLKIMGQTYQIILFNENETGNENLGTHWGKYNKIWIGRGQARDRMETVLLHEIMEAIRYHLDLSIDHNTLTAIATTLFQILKDNKLSFYE